MTLNRFLWPEGPARTALVGAGGKTTVMALVAQNHAGSKRPVLLSTTTKLQRPCPVPGAALHTGPDPPGSFSGPLLWVGISVSGGRKWSAPPPGSFVRFFRENELYANHPFDVLIEADGSAGRPVKAPSDFEPVVPEWIDTVAAVMGLSALGRRVDGQSVHRLSEFERLTGAARGDLIGTENLLRLLTHSHGTFKGARPGMRRLLILTQADDNPAYRSGITLAESVISQMPELSAAALVSLHSKTPVRCIIHP